MTVTPRHRSVDPASFVRNGSEHGHQVAFFCWAANNFEKYPELRDMYAIPNGGERNKLVAASLKAEGVKAGVPDIFLPVSRGRWHGLYIELKRPKLLDKQRGYCTTDQKDWHTRLQARGFGVAVCVGYEEAIKVVVEYLEWKG